MLRDVEKNGDIVTEFYTDQNTGELTINRVQDIAPIIKNNKTLADINDGYSKDRSMQLVADIPMVVVHQLRKEGINIYDKNDWPKIVEKLNNGDLAAFRVGGGQI